MTQLAMTQNFVRITTDDTESDFLEFRQFKDDEKIIAASDVDTDYFDISILQWYNGYTLACRSNWVFDLYRVYDGWELIAESEDEIIQLPKKYNPHSMTVKAFDRYWDNKLIRIWAESWAITELHREKSDFYKLSVVVPCYKASLFMSRTIDAILSSSLDSIEVIIVNDGSPENDLEIAKRYADHYGCVKVIDQPNQWLCVARNAGMDIAKGEYLAFCDADDIPHPYEYGRLYAACKEYWTDIAISQVLIRTFPNVKERYYKVWKDVVYTFDEMASKKHTEENIYFCAVRNKIVKTEVARKARHPIDYAGKIFTYEDIAYTWSLYSYIDRFAYCDSAIHTWDKRKRNTVWTVSTWYTNENNDYMWQTFIFWALYPLYNKSWNHNEWHDYIHFEKLTESYNKFTAPSPMKTYWDTELKKLIDSQKLYENKLIMWDNYLSSIVKKLWNIYFSC